MRKISLAIFGVAVLSFFASGCAQQAAMPGRAFEGKIDQVLRFPGLGKMMTLSQHHSQDSSGAIDTSVDADNTGALFGAMATAHLTMYVREDKIAYEVSLLGGLTKIRTIIDRATRTITILSPNHVATVINLRQLDTMRTKLDDSIRAHHDKLDSIANSLPKPTGKKRTINGFEAEEYRTTMQGMDIDMWLTNDPRMKFYEVVQDAILGRQKTGLGGVEELFQILSPISHGKVPVKFDARLKGEPMISSEVKDMVEEKVDDKMFEIPKDYKIVQGDRATPRDSNTSPDSGVQD